MNVMQKACFFNMNDMTQGDSRKLAQGVTARLFSSDRLTVSIVQLAPNAASPVHKHSQEQWGFLLEGKAIRIQGDAEIPVSSGDFWRTPPEVLHGMKAGEGGAVVLDIFNPPRDS